MGAFDVAFPALAQTLVGTFGTEVRVEIITNVGYDPATRKASAVPGSLYVTGVIESYNVGELGDQVKATDYKVHVAAADLNRVPKNGDHVLVSGATMRVVSVRTEYAGGAAALYTMQVRG